MSQTLCISLLVLSFFIIFILLVMLKASEDIVKSQNRVIKASDNLIKAHKDHDKNRKELIKNLNKQISLLTNIDSNNKNIIKMLHSQLPPELQKMFKIEN